jgi:hypothetical protein
MDADDLAKFRFTPGDSGLWLGAAQEKLDGVVNPFGKLVGPGKVDSPLADHRVEESFHKFSQVHDRKIVGDLAALLALRDDFPEQANRGRFRASQLGRTYRVHCTGKNHRLPKGTSDFGYIAKGFVKSAQSLLGSGFDGQLRFEAFRLASEGPASHFSQNRIFTGEIPKKSRLANIQSLYDVVDAGLPIAVPSKKVQSRFYNLLAEPGFFALAQATFRSFPGRLTSVPGFSWLVVSRGLRVGRRRTSLSNFGAAHDVFLLGADAAVGLTRPGLR